MGEQVSEATAPAPLAAGGMDISVGTRQLVKGFSASFGKGEFVAVLGRNGCGKTLTLHTLAGLRQPEAGVVLLDGAPLAGLARRAIAQRLGVLTQDLEEGFVTTVSEMVLLGRHPHLSFWQWEAADDMQIADMSLAAVELAGFGPRQTDTLSGGELRRVAVASLLAQTPDIYLLDEPTNHLDPHHQLAVLKLFRGLADRGAMVIATLHDATLAARFADRAVLLFGDGRWRAGAVDEVMSAEGLSELYLTPMVEVRDGARRIFVPQ
jgi:iron complex transport system ATP-binding protein